MRRDAATNRERVISAAEEVFADRGPAATLEDVATAAGVGPATLYRRFANKDALVQEVLTGFFRRLIEVAETAAQAPPEVGLEVFLRTVGIELAVKGGLSAPMWGELAPAPLVEHLRGLSTQLLRRAQRQARYARTSSPTTSPLPCGPCAGSSIPSELTRAATGTTCGGAISKRSCGAFETDPDQIRTRSDWNASRQPNQRGGTDAHRSSRRLLSLTAQRR